MLILRRKRGEQLVIGRDIEVTVLEVNGKRVKLGFSGPSKLAIYRKEVYLRSRQAPPADRSPSVV
jgi:carbon storage regulator